MSKSQLDKYQEMKIQTASPQELLLLTYDESLKAMRRAARQMTKQNQVQTQAELMMAMACVLELDNTLNVEAAPELGAHLHNLYMYVIDRLADVIATGNTASLSEAQRIVTELHQTWKQAFEQAGVRVPEPA